jgi:hypothetical protein
MVSKILTASVALIALGAAGFGAFTATEVGRLHAELDKVQSEVGGLRKRLSTVEADTALGLRRVAQLDASN